MTECGFSSETDFNNSEWRIGAWTQRSTIDSNSPKARLPGKGESQPAVGEGCRPFEPGRIRDDLVLRARWKSATAGRFNEELRQRSARSPSIEINE
jgi:hypothetical protein